ncbi:MAG: sensor histidine kinase, partial [Clostridia bacterium]|nr:sensor histidine kinase [Clostridia bacterium]
DITMNSVRAGATDIDITLDEADGKLTFSVRDNGCGMDEETVRKLSDPFFTTRKTRKVGLGVPFLRMLAEMTDGSFSIESVSEKDDPVHHGTLLTATFTLGHLDFVPLGDLTGTVVTLIQGYPDINFTYVHRRNGREVRLSCREMREVLGDDISLASYEVLAFIRNYLEEAYAELDTEIVN